jgi:glyoxylase-like metal-dependent hydrolase (beta-lactamase superfamily II)
MQTLSAGLSYIDLRFRDIPGVVAASLLHGSGGVALIDPGPSSTLPVLRLALEAAGIGVRDITALLLTHIHLDHAGACGTLVRENPRMRVFVHERGAAHLANPEKLLASATRLYGEAMDRLWGEVRPVPAGAIVSLAGGERVDAAGCDLEVAHTPGHASHHVSYLSCDTGVAFAGDVAGILLRRGGHVVPPTPPPDIDLEQWHASLSRIEAWRPDVLFLTHFGPVAPATVHLSTVGDRLEQMSQLAQTSLARDGTDEEREAWFADALRREVRCATEGDAEAHAYECAGQYDLSWRGLARYWRRKNKGA